VISDTHGLLRPEARAFLVGCDYIIHGGDIGSAAILDDIGAIAPLTAVKGNIDKGSWARRLRETELIRWAMCLPTSSTTSRCSTSNRRRRRSASSSAVTRTFQRFRNATACCSSIPEAAARAASAYPFPSAEISISGSTGAKLEPSIFRLVGEAMSLAGSDAVP
jgi:hypothetical protein